MKCKCSVLLYVQFKFTTGLVPVPSLRMIRDILDRSWMEQADIEILISLCSGNLTRLDITLNTFSAFKFYNLTTLFQFVGECVVLKHLLLSQSHEATVPTLSHMTLPSFLNSLQLNESTLACLTRGPTDLSSLTMIMNNKFNGSSLVQIASTTSLKHLHLDYCDSLPGIPTRCPQALLDNIGHTVNHKFRGCKLREW